jgi:hypothetical protein
MAHQSRIHGTRGYIGQKRGKRKTYLMAGLSHGEAGGRLIFAGMV